MPHRLRDRITWQRSCYAFLVRILQNNAAQLADFLAHQLASNRYLDRFRQISEPELSGITSRILEDYAAWAQGEQQRLLDCRDFLANSCFMLSIPVVEAAYALYVLRDELEE